MEFTLCNQKGELFHSTEHLPLIVYFYAKDNTAGCTTEGLDFNRLLPQFQEAGYTVVGISRDSVVSHQKFCAKHDFQFHLLSDTNEIVCRQFDVLKPKKMYGKEYIGIERSTFVLNELGEVVHEWRKVKVAQHAENVLAWIQAA